MPLVKGVEADCVFSSFSGINALNTWGGEGDGEGYSTYSFDVAEKLRGP